MTVAKQISQKLENISSTKTSFSEDESNDMLSSATALASDTSITTKTMMSSLVSTVTNVIKKV